MQVPAVSMKISLVRRTRKKLSWHWRKGSCHSVFSGSSQQDLATVVCPTKQAGNMGGSRANCWMAVGFWGHGTPALRKLEFIRSVAHGITLLTMKGKHFPSSWFCVLSFQANVSAIQESNVSTTSPEEISKTLCSQQLLPKLMGAAGAHCFQK